MKKKIKSIKVVYPQDKQNFFNTCNEAAVNSIKKIIYDKLVKL